MFKKDNIWLGVVAGLFLPAVAFGVVRIMKHYIALLAKDDLLYILCAAVNLVIVRYSIRKEKERTAHGIVASTFVCALIFIVYKLSKGE
jgi:hypothetical protein